MNIRSALAAALMVCLAATASAQTPATPDQDDRTQYPGFMANSFFTFSVGSIGYLFSSTQLEPGFRAEAIIKPRLSVRVDLFGHQFTKYLSMQASYLRPTRFIEYRNVNGTKDSFQVSNAYAGVALALHLPVTKGLSFFGEGGGGVTSRSGITIDHKTALAPAHYTSGLLGAGLDIRASQNIDLILQATYLPGRRSFEQPSTRMYTGGLRYHMRPVPDASVEANRESGYAFPANYVRFGLTTNAAGYGLNDLFSKKIPIFWGGNVETARGITIDYQRNVFHTSKIFAFDLGMNLSDWQSNGHRDVFHTFSGYPVFQFFFVRSKPADVFFNYSLAGPTFISRTVIDGLDTGARFTFQDFMTLGTLLGRQRRALVEIGIKHYSNGNLFPTNASVKIPLTLSFGYAF